MQCRTRAQLAEILGSLNRWYCSQEHGRKVDDPELLVRYYVSKGGAEDFARRFDEAMSPLNRWYCSQFYRRDIRDPETLWNYYTRYAADRGPGPHNEMNSLRSEFGIAS
jgi:hypothetical protein